MLKRVLCLVLCLAVLLPACALASVSATPNQQLAFRTGPNTKYDWLFHMPQDTQLTAIEYEQGNGVTWVLVEFWRDGKLERGYTGLKRMTVNGDIPWADHLWEDVTVIADGVVYSGPGYEYASHASVAAGDGASVLRYENGFAFIEFYDYNHDGESRGWVTIDRLFEPQEFDWNSGVPYAPDDMWYSGGTLVYVSANGSVPLYETPYAGTQVLCWVPAGSVMESYYTTGSGHLYVYYDGYYGYVEKKNLSLY